jgi:hypothetical protein
MAREGSANHLYAAAEPEGQIVDGMSILSQDHPFYSSLDSEFKNLGQVVQVGSVFWSGVSHQKLNHRKAANFCADRAADLPTEAQCRSLAAAMGVGSASEWAGYRFWTSERKENGAVFFDGTTGELSTVGRDTPLNVRCVTTE